MIVEVFKTDVEDPDHANALIDLLLKHLPHCDINFDLDDCDKILRIAGNAVCAGEIKKILAQKGVECECLD